MDLAFATLDVFTSQRLEGNPLAVVRVPASLRDRLTEPMKQKIAKEFNLSETVFLHDGAFLSFLPPPLSPPLFPNTKHISNAKHVAG